MEFLAVAKYSGKPTVLGLTLSRFCYDCIFLSVFLPLRPSIGTFLVAADSTRLSIDELSTIDRHSTDL